MKKIFFLALLIFIATSHIPHHPSPDHDHDHSHHHHHHHNQPGHSHDHPHEHKPGQDHNHDHHAHHHKPGQDHPHDHENHAHHHKPEPDHHHEHHAHHHKPEPDHHHDHHHKPGQDHHHSPNSNYDSKKNPNLEQAKVHDNRKLTSEINNDHQTYRLNLPNAELIEQDSSFFGIEFFKQNIKSIIPENNIYQQVFWSIVIVSSLTIPIFLVLIIFSSFGKSQGSSKIYEGILNLMISFAVGSLIGDVFLHIIPHLIEDMNHSHNHDHDDHHHHGSESHNHSHDFESMKIWIYLLGGILIFFFADNVLKGKDEKSTDATKHNHDHSHHHHHYESTSLIYLLADFSHNFIDGIAIATSYSLGMIYHLLTKQKGYNFGLSTTFAILFHELPHELGDFGVLLKKKLSLIKVLGSQILTSLGALLGGFLCKFFFLTMSPIVSLIGLNIEIKKQEIMCVTAGGFLYLALSNLVPELGSSSSNRSKAQVVLETIFISLGIGVMYFISLLEQLIFKNLLLKIKNRSNLNKIQLYHLKQYFKNFLGKIVASSLDYTFQIDRDLTMIKRYSVQSIFIFNKIYFINSKN